MPDLSRDEGGRTLSRIEAHARPLHFAFAVPAARPRVASTDRLALGTMKAALVLAAAVSVGNFNELLVTSAVTSGQQAISMAAWSTIAGASVFVRREGALRGRTDLAFAIAFYVVAAVSVLWSDLLPASILKSAALAVTTVAAYRMALRLTADEIVDGAILGLALQCAASVLVALALPQIGVLQVGMHLGQWAGIFESKQSLGTVGAFLVFFAGYRVMTGGRWLPFLACLALATASLLGSGSRGGGATALAAVAILYAVRRSPRLGAALAFGPLVMILVACALLAHLALSGNAYFVLFDERIDLTERTFIWHHALQRFEAHALLGYGLNGFWSIDAIAHAFKRQHGWVLDNYHSGYLTILMETGLAGLTLFLLWFTTFGFKMAALLRRRALEPAHAQLVIAYMNLIFVFDFTETFFLRSTNLVAALMAAFFFISCRSSPLAASAPAPRHRPAWSA